MKRPLHTLRRSESAFTLIEVVLAISIAAIGIIAILGLLPNAIQSGRDAADNTLSATVVQDIFGNIRSQPLDKVFLSDGTGPYNFTAGTYTVTTPLISYFDYTGAPTNTAANAYYKTLISVQQQAALPLWNIQVAVVWPAVSKSGATTNIFVTNVTPYD